ncbi:SDR family NAD(P)-dependent oxidoreductase [Paenibacillus hunanensis]|uniref:SDR family NAD(P)-dependent oxidoreductase n=1 Tax=Paenibacillus hunanensis TaxID=539262 RepID=UPI002A6ADAF4|nr:SDR family NAD(P)-dependent oxidoreductase [Paenibacillus hunanensis]WPP40012.1 SDR family NAD(P)-dependent oxidoreductase [Paenibacillus hunanensis]
MESKKIALVTGANKGIGKAIVKELANRGMIVFLGSRNAERGRMAVAELQHEGEVHYARELASTQIKVNAAAPGHVATDFNDFHGTRTPEEGAAIAVKLATLDEDGPTGGFFDDTRAIPW